MFSVYAQNPNFDDLLSALHLGEMPEGVLGPGQVRVQLKAASLNWHDLWTLRGVGMRPLKFRIIMGCDGSVRVDTCLRSYRSTELGNSSVTVRPGMCLTT